jgi:aminopeptidase-like protein
LISVDSSVEAAGQAMHSLAADLYPIPRSITGDGLRETLRRVGREIPLEIHEVATGTAALDWEVPNEWNIRGARIETIEGRVVVDFADSNLHVVSYSLPIDAIVSRDELAGHIHTLPEQPDLIPYRTAYYAQTWGFCLPHTLYQQMTDPAYRVVIDSAWQPGHLTYGEAFVAGEEKDEVVLSVHCCHPSLANDNLSGIAVATWLAKRQMARPRRRLGYRFLFLPATIGAIVYLSRNEPGLARIRHGLVLTCVGDPGRFHYKASRRGDADVDRIVGHVLRSRGAAHQMLSFAPEGYDERQYCSPGYDLPFGCFMRSPNGTFPEYHTSADNLDFITPAALAESYDVLGEVLNVMDTDTRYARIDGRGEPQLGRRGLYRAISGQAEKPEALRTALLWVLNLSDGGHSLLDIAERSGVSYGHIVTAAKLACEADLIREVRP